MEKMEEKDKEKIKKEMFFKALKTAFSEIQNLKFSKEENSITGLPYHKIEHTKDVVRRFKKIIKFFQEKDPNIISEKDEKKAYWGRFFMM